MKFKKTGIMRLMMKAVLGLIKSAIQVIGMHLKMMMEADGERIHGVDDVEDGFDVVDDEGVGANVIDD